MPALRPNEDGDSNSAPSRDQHRDGSSPDEGRITSPAPSPPPPRQAWTVRGQLLLDFHHAISRAINSPEMAARCSQIAEDMSRNEERGVVARRLQMLPDCGARRPSAADEYGAEAALIVENKARRDEATRDRALALGLFAFVTLRSGRGLSGWMKRAIASRSYRLEPVPEKRLASTVASKALASTQPSKLRWRLRLAFDAAVSASLAVLSSVYLFAPRPAAYVEDMAKLPLVEGKSAYAEMVCPPLLREYRRVLERYGGRWPVRMAGATDAEDDALTQEDVGLNVVRSFVRNCTKREKYERALLEERNAFNLAHGPPTSTVSRFMPGLAERRVDNPASIGHGALGGEVPKLGTFPIPSPGVPENIPINNLDQEVLALFEEEGGEEGICVKDRLSTMKR